MFCSQSLNKVYFVRRPLVGCQTIVYTYLQFLPAMCESKNKQKFNMWIWRNWQTRKTKDLVVNNLAGSIPVIHTKSRQATAWFAATQKNWVAFLFAVLGSYLAPNVKLTYCNLSANFNIALQKCNCLVCGNPEKLSCLFICGAWLLSGTKRQIDLLQFECQL